MSARVTMRDVAREVGVSPMTVSRALRDDKTVSAGTRARIQQVARDMGYVYDTTAQAFRTQKSGFVAVTLPSINNANFAETFRGLTTGLSDTGLQLLLASTNYRVENEEDLVRQLLTRQPEAMVLTGGHHTQETRQVLSGRGLPIVEIWDLPAEPLGHVVGFSNAQAMAEIVRHLVETGRRRLAFIGASAEADLRGSARRDGVVAEARRLGLPEVALIEAGPAPVSMRHGARAIAELRDRLADFDALVCVSDPVAFGALSECRRLGMDVPGDIAIAGFGHFEVAAISEPRITTVAVHANEIGVQVARILKDETRLYGPPIRVDVGVELVRGDTT